MKSKELTLKDIIEMLSILPEAYKDRFSVLAKTLYYTGLVSGMDKEKTILYTLWHIGEELEISIKAIESVNP